MRKVLSIGLVVAMAMIGGPWGALAAGRNDGALNGVAQGDNKKPLANVIVRVRSAQTGDIAGSTTSGAAGQFSFAALPPGTYVVEVVNAAGRIVGLSPSIAVTSGATVSVTVSASAAGAIGAASAGGFSLFGLGSAASAAVIAAAGAVSTAAVIAANRVASPSK